MRKGKGGTILLVTLWLLAILSLLAIGIGFRTSIDLKLAGYQIDSLKAYEIAKAGIAKAMKELQKDESPDVDTIWECGITLKPDETLEERFKDIKVGEGRFGVSYMDEGQNKLYGIEDMQGKININTAPKDVLASLPAQLTSELVDSIRAWRGDTGEGAPSPQPQDYADKPYTCKGASFDSVCELLLVKGVTKEIYYGENGNGLKDLVTTFGPKDPKEFKININTASQRTLEAVLGAFNLDRAAAENIAEYRAGEDKDISTRADNRAFANMTELLTFLKTAEGGDLNDTTLANLTKVIVFNSSYFKIRSEGILEGSKSNICRTITCVVNRKSLEDMDIISWVEE
jgi:general secretion pathway protein K